MNGEVLMTVLIEEHNSIEILLRRASLAPGFDDACFLAQRERERRHIVSIVNASDDERLVGIALFEDDHHFVPDARPEESTPSLARPHLGDTDPAGTVGVHFAFAVPMKLDLHAAVFIDPDFLAPGPDHGGGLHARDLGYRSHALGPVAKRHRNTHEGIFVAEWGYREPIAAVGLIPGLVFNLRQQICAVGVEMAFEREFVSGSQLAAVAFTLDADPQHLLLLHAETDGAHPVRDDVRDVRWTVSAAGVDAVEALRVAARIIVNLQ